MSPQTAQSHDTSLQADDARHLLRRLTFASTPDAERLITGKSVDAAFTVLVASTRQADTPAPPPFATRPWTNTALRTPGMTSQQYQALRLMQSEQSLREVEELRRWWLREMIVGTAPLRENLVLFMQGTLGSSSFGDAPQAIHDANASMRSAALDKIPVLLEQLVAEPQMILQLGIDEYRPDKDGKLFDRPARLVLDNWTVGTGEYTERDVAELSRAMTGWMLRPPKGQPEVPVDTETFRSARRTGLEPNFEREYFDDKDKTILGKTGNFDSRSAIRYLSRLPATARRYSRLLIAYFGVADPDRELEARVTQTYRSTDGSMEAMLRDIVLSKQFWSQESRWALIKSPVHLVVGACRQLQIGQPPMRAVSTWLLATGQQLFDTPNFGDAGWAGQEAWVTPPDRLLVRYELAQVLGGHVPALGVRPSSATGSGESAGQPGSAWSALSVADVLARLDPAPGIDRSVIERNASNAKSDEKAAHAVQRILSTLEYQMA